jgi:hypothetical protein
MATLIISPGTCPVPPGSGNLHAHDGLLGLYPPQHPGCVIPPHADSAWLGKPGPRPSYLDPGSGGPENDFTNRNTTFLT